jgi:transposase
MARYEVSDELWVRIEPLLPVRARRARWPGRLPLDDRACLNGILFVLLTGISWVDLPQQLGYGSGIIRKPQVITGFSARAHRRFATIPQQSCWSPRR